MKELYDSADYKNLKFEYAGSTRNVSFYESKNSIELSDAIKISEIKFSETKNKNEFLNELSNIKIGKNILNKKKMIILLDFTFLEKRLLIFLKTILKCYLMQIIMQNKMKLRENDLKY